MAKSESCGVRSGFIAVLIFAVFSLCLFAFPVSADAKTVVDAGSCGPSSKYTLYDDGSLEIKGTGAVESQWGNTSSASQIKSVSISEGITSLSPYFLRQSSIQALTIPSTVESIGACAFEECAKLRTVVVEGDPSQLVKIDTEAFYKCSALRSFSWNSSSEMHVQISHRAFDYCTSLNSFDIPEGLAYFESSSDSPSGYTCFLNCPFLQRYGICGYWYSGSMGETNPYWWSSFYFLKADGTLVIVGQGDIRDYSKASDVPWANYKANVRSLELSENISAIGDYALFGCTNLSEANLPRAVSRIGNYAFAYSGLESLIFQEKGAIEEIEDDAFEETSSDLLIDCAWNGIPAVFADDHGIEAVRKPFSIENAVVVIEPPLDKAWTGKEIEPDVTVMLDGKQLIEDEDYSVTYEDNVGPGTATVTIEGEGHYWRSVTKEFYIHQPVVVYSAGVEGSGSWQEPVSDGEMAGTSGLGLRMEGLKMGLEDLPCEGGIRYQAQIQSIGWQDWKNDGEVAGFDPKKSGGKRLETIKIELTGEIAKYYDIYYHLQVQRFGWMGWAKNGEPAGTVGYSFRVEAIEAVLIPKETGERDVWVHTVATPEANMLSYARTNSYDNRAWQGPKGEGDVSGTRGKVKSAILFGLPQAAIPSQYKGNSGIRYQVYQNNKWSKWYADDAVAGDKKNPIRGIKVELTGNMAKDYDVYYRVEVKDGKSACWLGWAKNGAIAGQKNINLEQVEVAVVKKGDPAPPTATNNSKQRWVLERWPCTWPKPAYRF